jgi:hypothetical protein
MRETPNRRLHEGRQAAAKWYREPWPWLLMSGPALVVAAACYTLWLAIASSDGLVADDYYARGLAINRTLARDHAAAAAHYEAQVILAPEARRVRVIVTGATPPSAVILKLAHRTRAGLDRVVRLSGSGGVYEGALDAPEQGRWGVTLEDAQATWRLTGDWQRPLEGRVRLAPHAEGATAGSGS